MKPIQIKYGENNEKTLVIDRDFFNSLFGIVLVISCALMSGLLQLVETRFNMALISTWDFWCNYLLKLVMGYFCLFGCYILRKNKNRRQPKFVLQRQSIIEHRKAIIKNSQIEELREWLVNVYNYRKRVEKYQDILLYKYEKVSLIRCVEPNEKDYAKQKDYLKAKKKYEKLKLKNTKAENIKALLEEQLKICDIHFKIINAYKRKDLTLAEQLKAEIADKDELLKVKIKHQNVTYNNLFNTEIFGELDNSGIFYNEKRRLAARITPALAIGIIITCIFYTIMPVFSNPSLSTVFMIFFNFIIIGWYSFSGIHLANDFIWKVVYSADSNRIAICDEFLEDNRKILG